MVKRRVQFLRFLAGIAPGIREPMIVFQMNFFDSKSQIYLQDSIPNSNFFKASLKWLSILNLYLIANSFAHIVNVSPFELLRRVQNFQD